MEKIKHFKVGLPLIALVIGMTVIGCASYTHFQSIRNETNNTVAKVFIRDTGTTDWGSVKNIRARTNSEGLVIRRQDGSVAYYDEYNINNGTQVIFFQETGASETPRHVRNKDIRLFDSNGISYTKVNVPIHFNTSKKVNLFIIAIPKTITSSDPIVFTSQDRDPMMTVLNNTGFPVRMDGRTLTNGGSISMQVRRESSQGNLAVNYSINNYTFSKEVDDVSSNSTVILTERPPILTIINDTGYNLSLTSPLRDSIANGGRSTHLKESRSANSLYTINYQVGNARYTEQVNFGDADATITLTKRPPVITIVNNTGNTINLVQIRIPGTSWWDYNILGLQLELDGITVNINRASTNANERSGSIINSDRFRAWLGLVDLPGSDRYDIRVDDVRGESYVKFNVRITGDMTLTFTQNDKPR